MKKKLCTNKAILHLVATTDRAAAQDTTSTMYISPQCASLYLCVQGYRLEQCRRPQIYTHDQTSCCSYCCKQTHCSGDGTSSGYQEVNQKRSALSIHKDNLYIPSIFCLSEEQRACSLMKENKIHINYAKHNVRCENAIH